MRQTFGWLTACLAFFCGALLLQLPAAVNAQRFPGACPKMKLLEEFDLTAYTGIWYEYMRYPFYSKPGMVCGYGIFENLGNDTLGVTYVDYNIITNSNSSFQRTGKVLGPGQFLIFTYQSADYTVLGTDYTTYAVTYNCFYWPLGWHTITIWILTRDRMPNSEALRKAKQVMTDNNLPHSYIQVDLQHDCLAPFNQTAEDQVSSEGMETVA